MQNREKERSHPWTRRKIKGEERKRTEMRVRPKRPDTSGISWIAWIFCRCQPARFRNAWRRRESVCRFRFSCRDFWNFPWKDAAGRMGDIITEYRECPSEETERFRLPIGNNGAAADSHRRPELLRKPYFFIKFLATAKNMVYSDSRLLVTRHCEELGDKSLYGKISCNSGIACKSEDD